MEPRLFHVLRGPIGAGALVFIHGNSCSGDDWTALEGRFASCYRTLSLDLRGHGRSAHLRPPFTIEQFAADIERLCLSSGLNEIVFVSHSMGNYVAIEVARKNTLPIRGLVLIDGAKYFDGNRQAVQARVSESMRKWGYRTFLGRAFAQMFSSKEFAAEQKRVTRRAFELNESVGLEMFPSVMGWAAENLPAALREVKVPTLAIQSTQVDKFGIRRVLGPEASSSWLKMCHAHLKMPLSVKLQGCGHFVMLERPRELGELIDQFLIEQAPIARGSAKEAVSTGQERTGG
jgi:pimeloyl-ACP methyl ester carboxylesterase